MAIVYKKLKWPPEINSGAERTDYICKQETDGSGNVIQDFWIPTSTSNRDYLEYQEWEAIDGNTIQEAD